MKNPTYQIDNLVQIIELMSDFISINKLAEAMCCTDRTVYRRITDLEEIGFVFEEKYVSKSKKLRLYRVPDEFKEQVRNLAKIVGL